MSNVYYDPEKFGLTIVAELDADLSYEFDMVIAWKDQDGAVWAAHDSGCSCPIPFEDIGYPSDMVPVRKVDDVRPVIAEMYSTVPAAEVATFIDKVRSVLR